VVQASMQMRSRVCMYARVCVCVGEGCCFLCMHDCAYACVCFVLYMPCSQNLSLPCRDTTKSAALSTRQIPAHVNRKTPIVTATWWRSSKHLEVGSISPTKGNRCLKVFVRLGRVEPAYREFAVEEGIKPYDSAQGNRQ
jgi:hypothetical protein